VTVQQVLAEMARVNIPVLLAQPPFAVHRIVAPLPDVLLALEDAARPEARQRSSARE
jgi:hypothetical protein